VPAESEACACGTDLIVCRCGQDRCPSCDPAEDKWCCICKRLIGVGCACGLTFAEKIKSVAIDKTSLVVRYPGQYNGVQRKP
jgi:hypothetical protein